MTKILLSLLTLCLAVVARADDAPRPRVGYKIDARLELDEKQRPARIDGTEQLTWRNDSPDAIAELRFHLYLNAFKNEKSTFFRESGGQLRGDSFQAGEWGWIDVQEMKTAGGEDLTPRIEFIHPDDDNADDQTVIRVPLARPLKPGETIALAIRFRAQLPRVFARTGYWGPFAMVAQWFPKIGVWEAVGDRHRTQAGWNCHQFHANSEFFADFGDYDVTMTVPERYRGKIGATGLQRAETANADHTVTYRFTQANVHDFAWTVDTGYLVVRRAFKAAEQVAPAEIDEWARRLNLPAERIRLRDVDVTLLIQAEHRGQIDRHFAAAFNAIKYYGLWYGAYPYDTLTVVDPPYNALGAGGMEYPTLITAGTTWWPAADLNPEAVIVHEFGHQFWYGLVASNEFEESWLDEGFNTYSEKRVLGKAYGLDATVLRFAGLPLVTFPLAQPPAYADRLFTLRNPFWDPIPTPAWKYYDSISYSLNSYPRTGLVLGTLERYLGEDRMARVMRTYQERWRYRHPASRDFFDTVNDVTGQDFGWFFEQFVQGTATLDYEVADLRSVAARQMAGVFDQDGKRVTVKKDDKDEDDDDAKDGPAKSYDNEVSIRRVGEAWFPIELRFRLRNGGEVTARAVNASLPGDGVLEYRLTSSWDGRTWIEPWAIRDRWKKFRFQSASELVAAEIDPERKLLLEANWTNNSRVEGATGIGAAARWSTGALFWLQTLLQFLGALS